MLRCSSPGPVVGPAGTVGNTTVRVPAPVKEHTSGERGAASKQRHWVTSNSAKAVVDVNRVQWWRGVWRRYLPWTEWLSEKRCLSWGLEVERDGRS